MKRQFTNFILIVFFPLFILVVLLVPKRRRELIWGPMPIINNKYWSAAVRVLGYESKTLMRTFYNINTQSDYDIYYHDLLPQWGKVSRLLTVLSSYFAFFYIIRNAAVVHIPFSGSVLGSTPFWRIEAYLLKLANIKTIVIPYGSDAYLYSKVNDFSLRHALLVSYPTGAKNEALIQQRVTYWIKHASIIVGTMMVEGIGRWDVLIASGVAIDLDMWQSKGTYSAADGKNAPVKILHAPNHRGFKGTEFLISAIKELQAEGIQVELVLLEKVPNSQVHLLMQEVDILAEQFIATGYGLNAIEGMASGLPVMSNLDDDSYLRVFRRYSYFNECPVLSTTPETLKSNLRLLISSPELREQLGRAGRAYAEKYHSYAYAQFLFGAIYEKILHNKDVDLINLFHPLKSTYNEGRSPIEHPLIENKLAFDSVFRSSESKSAI